MELFNAELAVLRDKLRDLQKQLDIVQEISEDLVFPKEIPVRFFNRINTGRLCELFSELTTMIYQYEAGFKQAMQKKVVDGS